MTPLDGLRGVELPGSIGASYCAKLLADGGAAVITVEPPGGDPRRRTGRSGADRDGSLFLALNGGKTSRVIDPAGGAEALEPLLSGADVLVAGGPVDADPYGVLGALDTWTGRYPQLVVTRVTPFGLTGPRAGWASSDLVQYAMALWTYMTGYPDRPPVPSGGGLAETIPGVCAASATLMALRWRRRSGLGQVVDVSQQESLLLCQPYLEVGFAYTGTERGRNGMPFPMTIVGAADGWLGVNVLTQTQWELLCAFAGLPHLVDDPRFPDPRGRAPYSAELSAVFTDWARDKDRRRTFLDAQGWRIPLGYVPHVGEVRSMEQHTARAFFQTVRHPGRPPLECPGTPFLVDGERWPSRPAPPLGAGSAGPAWAPRPDPAGTDGAVDRPGGGGPLAGLRVVDLSMYWSGPLAAELLAQYGADVVKVEAIQRVDGWRGMAADPSVEKSNIFNGVNLNKLGITLDLTSEAGRELLRPLVEAADVLIENFSPRVMGNFGLTDEVLHGWNPALVILSMPAFGRTGPWRDFVGFAPTIEQLSSLPELTRYPDGTDVLSGHSLADPTAGLVGCFAALAVLHGRDTGAGPPTPGPHIDLSQLEALTSLLGPELLEEQLGGRWDDVRPDQGVPAGVYPGRAADSWIVLSAPDEATWAALADVAGRGWAADPRFADSADRRAHRSALDVEVAAWTRTAGPDELAERLQARGVPAAPVLRPSQLATDEHLAGRGTYHELVREHVAATRYPGLPWKLSRSPGAIRQPGPTLGQDNDTVLGGRLGRSPADLDGLRRAGVIGEEPARSR